MCALQPSAKPSMPSDSVRDALHDIRDNIYRARQFVEGLSFESFKDSALHFYAATRALEIISEAARRLPPELQARHAHLPWRDIRDAGNFYRHRYDNVMETRVWQTILNDLGALLAVTETEINRLEAGS